MPQAGVDFGVLTGVGITVEWLCAPVAGQTARATAVAEVQAAPGLARAGSVAAPVGLKEKASAMGEGSPIKIQVLAVQP
jgi:phage tail protein X